MRWLLLILESAAAADWPGRVRLPPADWVAEVAASPSGVSTRVVDDGGREVDLTEVLGGFEGKFREPWVTVFSSSREHVASPPEAASVREGLTDIIRRGQSAVFRIEELDDGDDPFDVGGRGVSTHIYVSAPGQGALSNHSDTTDVAVWQLAGTKSWFACGADRVDDPRLVRKLDQCATYDADDMGLVVDAASRFDDCSTFDLEPGQSAYLPRRTVHSATAAPRGASVHVTVGVLPRRVLQSTTYESGCEAAGLATGCFCEELTPENATTCDLDGDGPSCPPGTFSATGKYSAASTSSCTSSCDASCDRGCDLGNANCDRNCDDSCDAGCTDCGGCEACPAGRYSASDGSTTCVVCDLASADACASVCATAAPSAEPTEPIASSQPVSKKKKKSGDGAASVGLIVVACLVLVVLCIGIGAAAYYYLRRSDASDGFAPTALIAEGVELAPKDQYS